MEVYRAFSVSLLLIAVTTTKTYVRSQQILEDNERVCSYTLSAPVVDGNCQAFKDIFEGQADDVRRISVLEEKLQDFNDLLQELREELNARKSDCPCERGDDAQDNDGHNETPFDHVIAKYSFEGNANDISGNGHHGNAINGVTFIPGGVSGHAASFHGNQKINVNSFRNFDWGSSFSVSVWFKRTGEWSNYQGIVSNGYHSTGSWEVRMGREMSGQMLGGGVNTADSPQTWNYINILASQNAWHHVVMTYDGQTLNYYLDNKKQKDDQTCCHGDMLIKDTPLTIGQAGVGKSNEFFYGLIDELVILSKVLSVDDVSGI